MEEFTGGKTVSLCLGFLVWINFIKKISLEPLASGLAS